MAARETMAGPDVDHRERSLADRGDKSANQPKKGMTAVERCIGN
jgi:hypothetical protein